MSCARKIVALDIRCDPRQFGLMYFNTYEASHAQLSHTRAYMALIMGAAMVIVMLGFVWKVSRLRNIDDVCHSAHA